MQSEDLKLPDNRFQAEIRLNSLKEDSSKIKVLHQKYVKTKQKCISCGHAEAVDKAIEVVKIELRFYLIFLF